MEIAFIIIGIIALWILRSIALNQKVIAKNQVHQSEILKEIESNTSQSYKALEKYNKAYHI